MSPLTVKNISELNNLELLANQVVEGFITGMHKSPFHGFSVEFAEHRLYNKGEMCQGREGYSLFSSKF